MTNLNWLRAAIQICRFLDELADHACIKKKKVINLANQDRETILIFAVNSKVMVDLEVNRIDGVKKTKDKAKPYLKVEQLNIKMDISTFIPAGHDVLDLTSAKALIDLKIVKTIPQPCENFPEVIPDLTFFSSKNEKSISQYCLKQSISLTDNGIVCTESSSVYSK